MRALIGSRGTIGRTILANMEFDCVYNSDTVTKLVGNHYSLIVCAAPSGNRLAVNQDHGRDCADIDTIVQSIKQASVDHIVLISSVDAVTAPDTPYGHNRARLEQELADLAPVTVLRLSTLIGANIKKNLLYDIKHNQFLSNIDGGAKIQWCLLDDLPRYIRQAVPGQVVNLVSEPITNQAVLEHFCPDIAPARHTCTVHYNQQPYIYSQLQIFAAMKEYLQ